jgi:polyisoprenoid-binding protein YceI
MRTKHDPSATVPRPGRYVIDPDRSTVTFRSRHLFGLAPVRGTVAVRSGTVDIAEPLAGSSVRVDIDVASFHTGNGGRDDNVRSARFLDAGRYPLMTFVAEHLDGLALAGTLTVRDVTRPVSLAIEESGVSARSFTVRATTVIDRFDFGLTALRGLAGRHLNLDIEVVAHA